MAVERRSLLVINRRSEEPVSHRRGPALNTVHVKYKTENLGYAEYVKNMITGGILVVSGVNGLCLGPRNTSFLRLSSVSPTRLSSSTRWTRSSSSSSSSGWRIVSKACV
ncbi:hypothetical protein NE237_026732 [Protea cynaroides]|uniref:Uncharacterized protein n=1 Tax=Protea cynaroides TaxID=273540 RepID=A0A9Q0JSV6_9MAGN|nr:hypothetical protein NE237_026732 [Protea cynaroides]